MHLEWDFYLVRLHLVELPLESLLHLPQGMLLPVLLQLCRLLLYQQLLVYPCVEKHLVLVVVGVLFLGHEFGVLFGDLVVRADFRFGRPELPLPKVVQGPSEFLLDLGAVGVIEEPLGDEILKEVNFIDGLGVQQLLHNGPHHPDGQGDSAVVALVQPGFVGISQKDEHGLDRSHQTEETLEVGVDQGYPALHLPRDEAVAEDVLEEVYLGLQAFLFGQFGRNDFLGVNHHDGPVVAIPASQVEHPCSLR